MNMKSDGPKVKISARCSVSARMGRQKHGKQNWRMIKSLINRDTLLLKLVLGETRVKGDYNGLRQ